MKRVGDLAIRTVRERDLEHLFECLRDIAIRGTHLPNLFESEKKFRDRYARDGFSSQHFERLLLVDSQDAIVGTLWHFEAVPYFDAREIGYIVFDVAKRSHGLATRGLAMVTDYLFESRTINRLEVRMAVENIASERVACKVGYQLEGTCRQANFVQGRYVDMRLYALLRADWLAKRSGS